MTQTATTPHPKRLIEVDVPIRRAADYRLKVDSQHHLPTIDNQQRSCGHGDNAPRFK